MDKLMTKPSEDEADFPTVAVGLEEEDGDNDGGFDEERHHAKLLDAISSLDGVKRVKHSLRTEVGKEVSEFGFKSSKGDKKKLLSELMNSANQTVSHGDIKKQIKDSQKRAQVLPAPLPKHEKEKIQRTVGYEKAVSEVAKWDPVVNANRKAQQLKFPLQQPNAKLINSHIKFTPRTPLELEIAAALKQRDPQHIIPKGKVTTPAEEKALAAMSVEEAKERRAELLKYRALLYNKESKLRWQNKIKSKRYRRTLKKERQKKEEKELEELARTDPEAFLERMNTADMERIQERMRLRHRGGGKFAKKAKIYAKFDDKKREEVQAMLRKSKELTQKSKVESSESEEEEEIETGTTQQQDESNVKNPWMQVQSVKKPTLSQPQPVVADVSNDKDKDVESSDDEEQDIIEKLFSEDKTDKKGDSSERKTTEKKGVDDRTKPVQKKQTAAALKRKQEASGKQNKAKKVSFSEKQKVKSQDANVDSDKDADESDSDKELTDSDEMSDTEEMELQKEVSKPETVEEDLHSDGDDRLVETTLSEDAPDSPAAETREEQVTESTSVNEDKQKDKKGKAREMEFVDPTKLLSLKSKSLKVKSVKAVEDDENDSDDGSDEGDDEGNRLTIAEAFEDDDVVAEFIAEKARVVDEEKPKDIDLSLPGWGEWGGVGVLPSQQKKKRFTIKAKPEKRADQHLGHVIISKKKNTGLEKHLVSQVPFPYKDANDYTAALETPIGREWNTENAFKRIIKPSIVTKSGTVIEPIDESVLMKKPTKRPRDVDIGLETEKGGGKKKRKGKK